MRLNEVIVNSGCLDRGKKTKKKQKFKEQGDKPFFMESSFDLENRVVLKNEWLENIEKFTKK